MGRGEGNAPSIHTIGLFFLAELVALVQKVYTKTFVLAEVTSDVAVLFVSAVIS